MSDKKAITGIIIIIVLLFVNLLSLHSIDFQNEEINVNKDKLMNLNEIKTNELVKSIKKISVLEERSPIKIYNNSFYQFCSLE